MLVLVLLGVFVGTVSLCVGAWAFVYRSQPAATTSAPVGPAEQPFDADERPTTLLRDTGSSDLEFLDRLLSGTPIALRLARELRQAGSVTKPDTFLLALGICGVSGALVGTMFGSWPVLPLSVIGVALPFIWLKQRQLRRQAAITDQLPEALDILMSAMRAGYSFQTAMKFVGEEMSAPLGPGFLRFYAEQRFGLETRAALRVLQDRCGTASVKLFVTAVLVHRDAGGSLSEGLTSIVDMLRRRYEASQQIEMLSAESRLAARVLTAVPLVGFGTMVAMSGDVARISVAEPVGWLVLAYAALSVTLGYVTLMRIAKVDL